MFLIFSPGSCLAAGEGTTAFDFLSLDVGPRQTAMGGAGVAVADDLLGAHKNPASLGRLWRQEVSFLDSSWVQNANYQYLGYAYPHETYGTFAISLFNLDYGPIQGYNTSGVKTGSVNAGDRMFSLSYGREMMRGLWGGSSLKYIQENLYSVSAHAVAADFGLLYTPSLDGWLSGSSLGFALSNLGTAPKFDQESAPLPRTLNIGAAFRPFFEGLTLAVDMTQKQAVPLSEGIGVEYWIKDAVAFRVGYNSAYDLGNGLGFGFGIKAWDVQIDYAFAALGDLGATQHVSLTYRFGSIAEKYYAAGMKYMRAGDYAKAIVEFGRVLANDPQHTRALLRITEANARLQAQMNQLKD